MVVKVVFGGGTLPLHVLLKESPWRHLKRHKMFPVLLQLLNVLLFEVRGLTLLLRLLPSVDAGGDSALLLLLIRLRVARGVLLEFPLVRVE